MSEVPRLTYPTALEWEAWEWNSGRVSVFSFFRYILDKMAAFLPSDQRPREHAAFMSEARAALAWLFNHHVQEWYNGLDHPQKAVFCTVLKHLARMCRRFSHEQGFEVALACARRWTPDFVMGWMFRHRPGAAGFPGSGSSHEYYSPFTDYARSPTPPQATNFNLGLRSAVRYHKAARRR
ncbi:hypothetical protein JCM10908_000121 [Rhodotorula pacifica]|uniref:uncharacterized protein n=1 Tax=Rhodotorula pacifica TaxID=1495444 RepID=UPI0031804C6A